jgi:hypothetical protein
MRQVQFDTIRHNSTLFDDRNKNNYAQAHLRNREPAPALRFSRLPEVGHGRFAPALPFLSALYRRSAKPGAARLILWPWYRSPAISPPWLRFSKGRSTEFDTF